MKTHLFGTEFQLQVWTALRAIPYGTTTTYKSVAEVIGNPDASRAVGGAVGKNPLPIVIEHVVGDEVEVKGTWSKTSPKGFANSDGLLVYESMENITNPQEAVPQKP